MITEDSPTHTLLDVTYDLRCQSDPLRVTKNNRVFGMLCDVVGEMSCMLLMSDGKLLLWQLKTIDYQVCILLFGLKITGFLSVISAISRCFLIEVISLKLRRLIK